MRAVDGVDLAVPRGRTVCVVGESGCGKSVTARSILQLVDPPGRIVEGTIQWSPNGGAGTDLAKLHPRGPDLRRVRGAEIGMVFQEPMASLSPMYTVGSQLVEAIQLHRPLPRAEAEERAVRQLLRVGIPQPEQRMGSYPFQLSGGLCQRVMIAIALSCDPALLIADEPTTALDVTTQARILRLLNDLQDQTGMGMLFITHDLGVVAQTADLVAVMYLGTIVEQGTVEQVLLEPAHPYTQALLNSIPTISGTAGRVRLPAVRGVVPHPKDRPAGCPFHTRCTHVIEGLCESHEPPIVSLADGHETRCHLYTDDQVSAPLPGASPAAKVREPERTELPPQRQDAGRETGPILEVEGLRKHFPIRQGLLSRTTGTIRAVDGVDLEIRPGETVGLVGESGCGKTTLGRCIAGILDPTAGRVLYRSADDERVDLAALSGRRLKALRTDVRMIFQDPFSSLNPRMTVEQIVGEPLRADRLLSGSQRRDKVADMLTRVGLRPEYMRRYPHAFSGGERQRLNIARALVTEPRLVICDEAVSALDVSVRAQILNLLGDLQDDLGLTYLFISHDLSVVEQISDRVAVMYLGRVVETCETSLLYTEPQHPYTEAMLHAVPIPDPAYRGRPGRELPDELPDPSNPPTGCAFHPRCPHARSGLCGSDVPELHPTPTGHRVACHWSEELDLDGVSWSRRPGQDQ